MGKFSVCGAELVTLVAEIIQLS